MSKDRVLGEAASEIHPGIDLGPAFASTIEREVWRWRLERWPKPGDAAGHDVWDALKLAEEAGEVAGAVVKLVEGRAEESALYDEMGDVLVSLAVIAGRHGWRLEDLFSDRWASVKER